MAISYRKRLIEFNKLKHNLLIKKAFNHPAAEHYFVEDDYQEIKNLHPLVAKVIWQTLEENIDLKEEYAISRDTCSFCIEVRLMNQSCASCKWAKNHKKCGHKKGDFTMLQQFMNKHNCGTIYSDEYKKILKEVRGKVR